MDEFDLVEPLVMNKRGGNVLISGHQRLKILKERGGTKKRRFPVVDLSPERERALNIALNKIKGDWDLPKLSELLKGLDDDLKILPALMPRR